MSVGVACGRHHRSTSGKPFSGCTGNLIRMQWVNSLRDSGTASPVESVMGSNPRCGSQRAKDSNCQWPLRKHLFFHPHNSGLYVAAVPLENFVFFVSTGPVGEESLSPREVDPAQQREASPSHPLCYKTWGFRLDWHVAILTLEEYRKSSPCH